MVNSVVGTTQSQLRRLLLAGALVAVASGLPAAGSVAAAAAQVTTAAAAGRVVDDAGQPVPGASVRLERDETGTFSTAVTGADGRFRIENLRPGGPYTISVSRIGYETVSRSGLTLEIGQRLTLEIVTATEAIALPELTVRVEGDLLGDPSRIGAASVVRRETLENLPTITRDFTEFAQLSPLVKMDENGASVAGANFRFNNIQVDGLLSQDVFGLSPSGVAGGQARGRVIPMAAVEQLQVLVAPYDVRQSGFTGGVLNAVTRSGTNTFTGSAFANYRDDTLVGDAVISDKPRSPGNLLNFHAGFDAGGPILKDRAHFFVAGEFETRRQPPDGFHVGVDDPILTRLSPDTVGRVQDVIAGFGVDAGQAGLYDLDNALINLFARFDYQLNPRHAATLRLNLASAGDDAATNRLAGDAYELSSSGSRIESRNRSVAARLLSTLSPTLSSEFLISFTGLRDWEDPLSMFPRVEVTLQGRDGEQGFRRDLRLGADFFSHDSELDQNIFQISEALSHTSGSFKTTVGAQFDRFGIRRQYLPGSLGAYRFLSLEDLAANEPFEYTVNLPLTADAATREFSVNQIGGYLQFEADGSRFDAKAGIRAEVPFFPGSPTANAVVEEHFGYRTDELPSGNLVLAPRAGVSWRPLDGSQLRGGVGLFTGRPPFSWLANAYQNTGLASGYLTCRRRNVGVADPEIVPVFDPGAPAPQACADGSAAESALPIVTVFSPSFEFPQDWKMSLSADQRLPGDAVLSIEWLYTMARTQISLTDLNLGPGVDPADRTPENGYSEGFGYAGRSVFGPGGRGNELVDPPPGSPPDPREPIFFPDRVYDGFGQVILIDNDAQNFSYALGVSLRKRFGETFSVEAGYSYNRSADTRSLASLDAVSNFGFTAVEGDPNSPQRQASLFDRPHKAVLQASAALPESMGGFNVSLLYIGQSGRPYSYVYADDINADSYPGLGHAVDLSNDLVYVPETHLDFPGGRSFISGLLFEQLVLRDPCLEESRVRILHRNACRTPWSNQLDLRVSRGFRAGGMDFELAADLINALNLMNRDWGHVRAVNPVVEVLRVDGRWEDDGGVGAGVIPEVDDPLQARYAGQLIRGEDGGIAAGLPHVPEIGTSQWQAQFGFRIRF